LALRLLRREPGKVLIVILLICAVFNLLDVNPAELVFDIWSGSELALFIGFLLDKGTLYGRGGMPPLRSLMLSFLRLDVKALLLPDLVGLSTRTVTGSSLIESSRLSSAVSHVDSVTHVLEPRMDELLGKNIGSP
jgi:hypothetical protein